jgi:hypothetical protein
MNDMGMSLLLQVFVDRDVPGNPAKRKNTIKTASGNTARQEFEEQHSCPPAHVHHHVLRFIS